MRFGRFHRRARQSGYVLMVLLFMLALVMLMMVASAPAIKQQIQREREEEMIHRGAQYARAIKFYFKKFGRYPSSFEQLENTNGLRFLRKRYADPMTADGKWKPLHIGDVKLGGSSNIGTPVSAMGTLGGGTMGQPASAFGGGMGQAAGQQAAGATKPSTSSSSPFSFGSSQVIGAPIIGVASTSEKEGLHEFNDKTHYNEWYFFYDPTTDRGGLITGPYTGKTFAAPAVGTPAGAIGSGASQPSGFGQPSAFGQQPSSFGQSGSFGQQPSTMGQPSTFGQQPQQQPQTSPNRQ